MRIFLDDERTPRVEQFDVIVRSAEEFKQVIANASTLITYISFDHDLGLGENGYDCAKFLVEYDLDHQVLCKDFEYNVHSANPVGSVNITRYLKSYFGE